MLESAKYFEQKNGFKVWTNATDEWLQEQEKKLGINRTETKNVVHHNKKTRIALIVDVKNWALDNIAKNIEKNLKEKYEFRIIYMSDIQDQNIVQLFHACKGFDIVHFLWRGFIYFLDGDFTNQYLSYYGNGKEDFYNEVINKLTITCSVYDNRFINDDDIDITKNIQKLVNYYTVSSKKLFDLYSNLGLKKPTMEITDGVDTKLFIPHDLDRFNNVQDRTLVVGWVGNSNYFGDQDHKGINTIIKPAINELIKEGYDIQLKIVDKENNYMSHDEMPNFYNSLDLYVCASVNEGTPNPVLEAMACGVPVVSTDVGIVNEVFGNKQKHYILQNRSKECLKSKIREIINNNVVLKTLSDENLESIKGWTWENKTKQFDEFFQYVLSSVKE